MWWKYGSWKLYDPVLMLSVCLWFIHDKDNENASQELFKYLYFQIEVHKWQTKCYAMQCPSALFTLYFEIQQNKCSSLFSDCVMALSLVRNMLTRHTHWRYLHTFKNLLTNMKFIVFLLVGQQVSDLQVNHIRAYSVKSRWVVAPSIGTDCLILPTK